MCKAVLLLSVSRKERQGEAAGETEVDRQTDKKRECVSEKRLRVRGKVRQR